MRSERCLRSRVERDGSYGELVLAWVRQPANGTWEAAEGVIDPARLAFLNLLFATAALRVTVERESEVGKDVTFDDELHRRAERESGFPDSPPTWLGIHDVCPPREPRMSRKRSPTTGGASRPGAPDSAEGAGSQRR